MIYGKVKAKLHVRIFESLCSKKLYTNCLQLIQFKMYRYIS